MLGEAHKKIKLFSICSAGFVGDWLIGDLGVFRLSSGSSSQLVTGLGPTYHPASHCTVLTLSPYTGLISTVVSLGEPVEPRLVAAGCVDFGVVVY